MVCVCVCACVRACVRAWCMCYRVCVCYVRACVYLYVWCMYELGTLYVNYISAYVRACLSIYDILL